MTEISSQGKNEIRYLLFPSVHYVIKAEKVLKKSKLWCDVVPTPKRFSSDCGVCLTVREADLQKSLETLREASIPPESVR